MPTIEISPLRLFKKSRGKPRTPGSVPAIRLELRLQGLAEELDAHDANLTAWARDTLTRAWAALRTEADTGP